MYTTHGHRIPGTRSENPPPSVARCSAFGGCPQCKAEWAEYEWKLNNSVDQPLTRSDALEWIGLLPSTPFEHWAFVQDLRLGQFWFNRLAHDDAEKLRGSLCDPYYKSDWDGILKALRYLLEH